MLPRTDYFLSRHPRIQLEHEMMMRTEKLREGAEID